MVTKSKEKRVRVPEYVEPALATEKLFVYGIFLDGDNRARYEMTNPSYDTVPGYLTVGHHIVSAVRTDENSVALTGLLVDVPDKIFPYLDSLEAGYYRVKVNTSGGTEAFMYVTPNDDQENFSSYKESNLYEYEPGQE